MDNQTNNKNKQNDKSAAAGIKNGNADWTAFQSVQNNSEATENVTSNAAFDANLTNNTNPNKDNQQ